MVKTEDQYIIKRWSMLTDGDVVVDTRFLFMSTVKETCQELLLTLECKLAKDSEEIQLWIKE